MNEADFSDDFKQDTVAQITGWGYSILIVIWGMQVSARLGASQPGMGGQDRYLPLSRWQGGP